MIVLNKIQIFLFNYFWPLLLRLPPVFRNYVVKRFELMISVYLQPHLEKCRHILLSDIEIKPSFARNKDSKIVWVCWLQGWELAPKTVNICLKSVREHILDGELILIDLRNISEYVTIDPFVNLSFKNGDISAANYTDFIRLMLLYEHGGLWVDATIFFTHDFRIGDIKNNFYSIRRQYDYPYVTRNLWSNFFIYSARGNKYFFYTYNVMLSALRSERKLINYFLMDHIFKFCFLNFSEFRHLVLSVEFNNKDVHEFENKIVNSCDFKSDNIVYKLNWRNDVLKDFNL